MNSDLVMLAMVLLFGALSLLRLIEVDLAAQMLAPALRRWAWAMRAVCAAVIVAGLYVLAGGLGVI